MEWTANYSAEFNKHKINALIGYSWEEENYEETHVQTRGFEMCIRDRPYPIEMLSTTGHLKNKK